MKKKIYDNFNLYIQNLIPIYGRKRLEHILDIGPTLFYFLESGKKTPSKKVLQKLQEFTGDDFTSPNEIKFKKAPVPFYPNIRKTIISSAFFLDQMKKVLYSDAMTNEEKDLITYFYLIKKGVKSLSSQKEYEVLTDNIKTEAVNECEKIKELDKEFKNVIGFWFLRNNRYFFQTANSTDNNGVRFLKSIDELIAKKTKDQEIKNKIGILLDILDGISE